MLGRPDKIPQFWNLCKKIMLSKICCRASLGFCMSFRCQKFALDEFLQQHELFAHLAMRLSKLNRNSSMTMFCSKSSETTRTGPLSICWPLASPM